MSFWAAKYLAGGPIPIHKDLYIATATAITKGQVVQHSAGAIIAMADPTDADDPVFGISAEAHDGSTAGRQSGTKIDVYDDPNIIFGWNAKACTVTATGGSTTTFVDSNLPNADDIFNGGILQVVTCASGIPAGTRIPITDYTGGTGTVTFGTQASAFAVGDTAYLFPGKRIINQHLFDLDAGADDFNWETSGGETFVIVDADPNLGYVFFKCRLHDLGNYVVAI